MTAAPLHWEKCPFCGECTRTDRVGKPLYITKDKEGKLHVRVNDLKRCGSCGKTWRSELPTMLEAMGKDGEEETAF